MDSYDIDLVRVLASKTIEKLDNSKGDVEKLCWMVVHQHHHGTMPFEYDIREIDEDLDMDVLNCAKSNLKKQ